MAYTISCDHENSPILSSRCVHCAKHPFVSTFYGVLRTLRILSRVGEKDGPHHNTQTGESEVPFSLFETSFSSALLSKQSMNKFQPIPAQETIVTSNRKNSIFKRIGYGCISFLYTIPSLLQAYRRFDKFEQVFLRYHSSRPGCDQLTQIDTMFFCQTSNGWSGKKLLQY